MNLKPKKNQAKPAASSPRPARPVRKLFELEAKPFESSASPLLPVRRPRRRGGRLLAALALFASFLGLAQAQETNAPPAPADQLEQTDPDEIRPRFLARYGLTDMGDVILTNDFTATNPEQPVMDTVVVAEPTELVPTPPAPAAPPAASPLPAPAQAQIDNDRQARDGKREHGSSRGRDRDRDESSSDRSRRRSDPSGTSENRERTAPPTPVSASANATGTDDFSAFRVIADRNIFNPNRYARRPGTESRPRPKVVESFALVGTMSYEKGTFAFFDGSASDYRKVLKDADQIAGYTLSGIGPSSVKLSKDGSELELAVGAQMRREEDGPWNLSAQSQPLTATTAAATSSNGAAAATTTSSSSGGSDDEVLKRLMQRREQE